MIMDSFWSQDLVVIIEIVHNSGMSAYVITSSTVQLRYNALKKYWQLTLQWHTPC